MKPGAAASTASARSQPIAGGEFGFDRGDFDFIANTLYSDAGIHLPASKANLVYSRLAKRLRTLGLESFRDYCTFVGSESGADERAQMISALTTNVTRFFREPHHFEHLKTKLLASSLKDIKGNRRFRIWSAGCSSGQEPFSIALTILSQVPDARSFNVRVLATDINPHVLDMARKGIYSAEEVSSIPPDMRLSWTEAVGSGAVKLDDGLRALVAYRQLNLMGGWPMSGPFDAIFCRNVIIYFDEATQKKMLTRMAAMIRPGGFLYLGHSERLIGPAETQFKVDGTTVYRKLGGAS